MVQSKFLQRSVAEKISIKEINESAYIKENDNEPSHVITVSKRKIYRTNTLGIVVNKEKRGSITSFLIDDGTSTIKVNLFEEIKILENLQIGNTVLLIARIREFNNIKYLAPEIIRIVDSSRLKVRSLFLSLNKIPAPLQEKEEQSAFALKKESKEKEMKREESGSSEDLKFPLEKLINLIKKLDLGDGAFIEKILEKSPFSDTEHLIEQMLERGEIFQNLPGKIKVL